MAFEFDPSTARPDGEFDPTTAKPYNAPPKPSAARKVADIGLALGQGAVSGVKSLVDVAGTDTKASRVLGDIVGGMEGLYSEARQEEKRNRQAKVDAADASGSTIDSITSRLGGFVEAPVQTLAQGLGSMAPTLATAVATKGRSAVAPLAVGVGMGVGGVKGQNYDAVLAEALKQGKSQAEAEALAQQAAEYSRQNAPQQALGGVLGALDAGTGVERVVGKVSGGLLDAAGASLKKRVVKNAIEEAIPEGLQGAQGQYAQNEALNNAGFATDPMSGVVGTGVFDAAVGGVLGAGAGIPSGRAPAAAPPPSQPVQTPPGAPVDPAAPIVPPAEPAPTPGDAIRAQKLPETGPLTKTVNVGIEQEAQAADAGAAVPLVPVPVAQELTGQEAARVQREADAPPPATGEIQEGDISRDGKPFNSMLSAQRALAKAGSGYTITPVAGGLVVRPSAARAALNQFTGENADGALTLDGGTLEPGVESRELSIEEANALMGDAASASEAPKKPRRIPTGQAEELAVETVEPVALADTDLVTADGFPYGTRAGAQARASRDGGEVIEVAGGFAVRPKESADAGKPANRPVAPGTAAVAAGSGAGRAPEAAAGNSPVGSLPTSTGGGQSAAGSAVAGGASAVPAGSGDARPPALSVLQARRAWADAVSRGAPAEEIQRLSDAVTEAKKAAQSQPTPEAPNGNQELQPVRNAQDGQAVPDAQAPAVRQQAGAEVGTGAQDRPQEQGGLTLKDRREAAKKRKAFTYAIKPREGGGFTIESPDGGGTVMAGKPTAPGILDSTPARVFRTEQDAREFMAKRNMQEAPSAAEQQAPQATQAPAGEAPAQGGTAAPATPGTAVSRTGGSAGVEADGVAPPGKDVMPAGLRVTFGGKTYPVESIADAQRKWSEFRDRSGAGVSDVGNGVRVTDGAGRFVARISYNGRAFDAEDSIEGGGNMIAEAPDMTPVVAAAPAPQSLQDRRADAARRKVYKTRAAAEKARDEQGNTHKLQKVKDGFIIRLKTEKEQAAEDRNGRRLAAGAPIDVENDSLLTAISKLGGIAMSERADTIGEGNRNVAGRPLFRAGGKNLDTLGTEALQEFGYIPAAYRDDPGAWLRDAIKAEFMGTRQHYSEQGTEWMQQDDAPSFDSLSDDDLAELTAYELEASGYTAATPEVQAITEALLADATAAGLDTEPLQERAAMATEGQSANDYQLALQQAIREALAANDRAAEGRNAGAAGQGGGDRLKAAGGQSQARADEGLTLTAQTPEELRAKAEREESARKAEAARKAADQERLRREAEDRDNKARADATVDDFQLGQDASVQMSGMGDLFDAPPQTAQPDYLSELFGSTPTEVDTDPFAVLEREAVKTAEQQRAEAKRIRAAIEGEKQRAQAEYDDWSRRVYKANRTSVDLNGDGPSGQSSMSIGALNERRRRTAMEALSQEIAALGKLERSIADDAGAAQFMDSMRALYGRAERIAADGNGLFKTPGEQFQYMLLDDLKFRGPAGNGNVTSNGLSRAVLGAVKGKAAQPAPARDMLPPSTGAEAAESAKRKRPQGTIEFARPIVGKDGNRLLSYSWQWKPFEYVDARGEERIARVSDWDNSATSAETGREVVHQFTVDVDGKLQTVSAEGALRLLGFLGDERGAGFKSITSAAKTLARLKMQQAELQSAREAFNKDMAEVKALPLPPMPTQRQVFDKTEGWWVLGDARARQTQPGPMTDERKRVLIENWRANRLAERGWKRGGFQLDAFREQEADLEKRITRAQKKVDDLAMAQPEGAQAADVGALPNPWEISQDEFVRRVTFTKEGSTAFPWVAKWGDTILEAQNEEYDHPDLGKTVIQGGRFSKTKREAEAVARGAHKRAVRRGVLNGNTATPEALAAYPDLQQAKKAAPVAEGQRATFTAKDGEQITGLVTQVADTSGGNWRVKIRTDEPAPQGGGNITRTAYSQDGTFGAEAAGPAALTPNYKAGDRITPEKDVIEGDIVRHQGREWMARVKRGNTVPLAPMVDGKPQVNADSVIRVDLLENDVRHTGANVYGYGGQPQEATPAEPAAQVAAILDAAAEPPKGKERLDVLKDVKAGAITPEEVAAAYPPVDPAAKWSAMSVAERATMLDNYAGAGQTDMGERYASRNWQSFNVGEQATLTAAMGLGNASSSTPAQAEASNNLNKRHSVAKKQVLTPAGALKSDATNSRADSSVWYYQGDMNSLRFAASVVIDGQPDPRAEDAKRTLGQIMAAQDAGWRRASYRAGSLGTVWVFERDGQFLTRAGMQNAGAVEVQRPALPPSAPGWDNIVARQRALAAAFNNWLQTLPDDQQYNRGVVSRKLGETPVGEWAAIGEDKLGLTLQYIPAEGEEGSGPVRWSFQTQHQADWPALREHIAELAGQFAAGESQPVPAAQPPATPPAPLNPVEADAALWKKLRAGEATVDEYRAGFESWLSNKAEIMTALAAKKKDDLLKMGGGYFAHRWKSSTKGDIVDALWREGASAYTLGEGFSYSMGENAYETGVRRIVNRATAETLAKYAEANKQAAADAAARVARMAEAIKEPKTLDDFNTWMRATMAGGKTFKEARMSLTPEQRATFDSLAAENSRSQRKAQTEEDRTAVRLAGQKVEGEIIATKHTRDGHDLFVVRLAERVSKEDYQTLLAGAKRIGGTYSSYRLNGAVPGFQFRTREAAQAFQKLAQGDNAAAVEAAKERRDAFADDRSQTAAERLAEMAERLEARASEVMDADRKVNTERRARFAASAEASARSDKAMARTMRNIAQAITGGTAQFLDRVRQKVQVELLQSYVATAQGDELRAKFSSYAEQERNKGAPPTTETADYAEFPTFAAYRSDLASLGRQLLEVDGTKAIGQRLMKVADDVSDAFLTWVKEPGNFSRVATFSNKEGGIASFSTKDAAEAALARSGLKGKGIAYQVKRGQYTLVLSPSEAMARGLWKGDGDKRLTLDPDFAAELVEKIGRAGRRGAKVSVPWQFERAYDQRKALARMGIETPAEFRAALREFIGLREQPAEADKVKQLERAMIGRRNDGLDFFPTPGSVADEMVAAADIKPGMRVLEPSAGMGHIAERIRGAGHQPEVVEFSNDRRELLEAKGFNVVGRDFLEFTDANQAERGFTFGDVFRAPDGTLGVMRGSNGMSGNRVGLDPLDANGQPDPRRSRWENFDDLVGVEKRGVGSGYDRILMNPPFSDGRDIEHVRHAYGLLKPGGRLVAIMGESAFFNQNKRATEFREWLEGLGGTDEKLPEGSFMDPSLPVNTSVNARMVVIEKPAADGAADAAQFSRGTVGDIDRAWRDLTGRHKLSDFDIEPETEVTADSLDDFVLTREKGKAYAALIVRASTRDDGARVYSAALEVGAEDFPKGTGAATTMYLQALNIAQKRGMGWQSESVRSDAGLAIYERLRAAGVPFVQEGSSSYVSAEALAGVDLAAVAQSVASGREPAAFSRNSGQGVTMRDAESVVEAIRRAMPKAPQVYLLESVDKAPEGLRRAIIEAGAEHDVEAAYHKGKIYAFPGNMASVERMAFVVGRHEVRHHGFRTLMSEQDLGVLMLKLWSNPNVRKAAQEQMADGKATDRVVAVEEALADMPVEELLKVKGFDRLVATLRRMLRSIATALRKAGFEAAASLIEPKEWTDADVAELVTRAENVSRGGRGGGISTVGTMLSRQTPIAMSSPDTRFSRSPSAAVAQGLQRLEDIRLPAGYLAADFMKSHGKLHWWHKTVGSMHNLAERNPAFKRVYDAAQGFLNDVSAYATESADLAPTLLPRLETIRDIAKKPLSAEDTKAIAAPIFEGTLKWTRDENGEPTEAADVETAGVVWTDAELRSRFGLNDKQVGLYQEFRAATNQSLTHLGLSDMVRYAGKDGEAVADRVMAAATAGQGATILADHLRDLAEQQPDRAEVLMNTAQAVMSKATRVADLIQRGYAPLSRFGHYTVDVVNPDGERQFFSLYESQAEANRAARKLREDFPDAEISQGTVSEQAYQMFAGVSPETVELFGGMLGLEAQGDNPAAMAFQEYLKRAKSTRSAMKRLIERKGIEGFSEDAGRVLAGFVYSNARQTAKNLHLGKVSSAVVDIQKDKGEGELLDTAVKLQQYITNPVEEAQKFKGLLFMNFLGGSVAAGLVNLSQTPMVTFPYLAQYGGVAKAATQMKSALADALKWETTKDDAQRTTGDARLDAALRRAEEEGVVSPQEVHNLIAQAGGSGALQAGDGTKAGDARATANNLLSRIMLGWGRPFAVAEQFNRRATFIAAYRTAVDQGMDDPAAFAERAVTETQFSYTKANRPQWARGAIGSTLFTFKTYSISYVELMSRLAKAGPEGKKAALLGIGMLFLMSGLQGLPGADDLDDLIDGALQRMGYNFDSKLKKRQFFASLMGEGAAEFVMRGVSGLPGVPIDVAGRLGMGNLIPGTGLLTKKQDYGQDVMEAFGPAGSFVKQIAEGADKASQGDLGGAAASVLPVALQNFVKAYDMASTGMYRDKAGRKVIDVDGMDVAAKLIGFQPNDVARVQQGTRTVQAMVALNRLTEKEIADKWARAAFEKDEEGVAAARAELAEWNRTNPESPIRIQYAQIRRRLKAMNEDKATRIERTAPKEIRGAVRDELKVLQ